MTVNAADVSRNVSGNDSLGSRLIRGAVGGLVAGLLFVLVTMWFVAQNGAAEMPLRMMSTVVKGDGAMAEGATSVGLGWAVHLVISALFGMVFAIVTPLMRTNGTVAVAGTVYGAGLYVVNFMILAPLFFTTFQDANQPFELVVHVVFGTLLSLAFFSSGPRHAEPVLAVGKSSKQSAAV